MAIHIAQIKGTNSFICILKVYKTYYPYFSLDDILDDDPNPDLSVLCSQEKLEKGYKTGYIDPFFQNSGGDGDVRQMEKKDSDSVQGNDKGGAQDSSP